MTFFKYIFVYHFTSTSIQKYPFVLEAKEGYLSNPPSSYSCMNILRLRHTKSLNKVILSYEVAGLHITAPILLCEHCTHLLWWGIRVNLEFLGVIRVGQSHISCHVTWAKSGVSSMGWKPNQQPLLEMSPTCRPTCLPVPLCCLVLDNSQHVTDTVTESQS